jgi:hypothetical protein
MKFHELLNWHLIRGTRPEGSVDPLVIGTRWEIKDFAGAVGDATAEGRSVSNWQNAKNLPLSVTLTMIENALFGANRAFAVWRADLRNAHVLAQQEARRARLIARHKPLTGQQSSPEPSKQESRNAVENPVADQRVDSTFKSKVGVARIMRKFVDRIMQTFSESELLADEAYFGADDQPIIDEGKGAARATWTFDDKGRIVEEAYFGVDGEPVLSKQSGVARQTWKFDDNGNCIDNAYFGVDGKPMLYNKSGVARQTWKFDDNGNCIDNAYFGVDGKPMLA